jgi:hypothetical protein
MVPDVRVPNPRTKKLILVNLQSFLFFGVEGGAFAFARGCFLLSFFPSMV